MYISLNYNIVMFHHLEIVGHKKQSHLEVSYGFRRC